MAHPLNQTLFAQFDTPSPLHHSMFFHDFEWYNPQLLAAGALQLGFYEASSLRINTSWPCKVYRVIRGTVVLRQNCPHGYLLLKKLENQINH